MAKGWKSAGKVTLYINEEATEANRQPHLKGSIEVTEPIPAGTNLSVSGWLNYQGTKVKSTSLALSYREDPELVKRLNDGLQNPEPENNLDKLPF